jgi:hypothetical protein
MRWPKYAAYIFMKYYISKINPNETYVAVDYAGEVRRRLIKFLLILKCLFCFSSHKSYLIVIVIIVLIQYLQRI